MKRALGEAGPATKRYKTGLSQGGAAQASGSASGSALDILQSLPPELLLLIVSNLVSLPVDAVLFVLFAFVFIPPLLGGDPMEINKAISRIVSGSTLFKLAVILALTPLVSLAPWREEARNMK